MFKNKLFKKKNYDKLTEFIINKNLNSYLTKMISMLFNYKKKKVIRCKVHLESLKC